MTETKLCTELPAGHTYIKLGDARKGGVYYVHSLRCTCGASENETVALESDRTEDLAASI